MYRNENRYDPYQNVYANFGIRTTLNNTLTKGNTVGGSLLLSLGYFPKPWLSVVAGTGIFTATFHTLKVSDKETNTELHLFGKEAINMSRIDHSLILRFNF